MQAELPELNARVTTPIRIPGELDVPTTPRVRGIIDSPVLQRLKGISQLGLVSQVYPGATHTRFEHSLGVYRLGCVVLQHLLDQDRNFASQVTEDEAKTFLLAALLHDVGHWPYCHPIEDLCLEWVPKHEHLARTLICNDELAASIKRDWGVAPECVAEFLEGADHAPSGAALQSVMNGPIDIDKMDYLQRDSLHAGVPYGRNFDVGRLIGSLCLGGSPSRLAISDKGKTAAEMMVFARYVMFSEVYWHHTVRAATAMLQRVVYELREQWLPDAWLSQNDMQFGESCVKLAKGQQRLSDLAGALFGAERCHYKRLAQFSFRSHPEVHAALAGLAYPRLIEISEHLAERLAEECGEEVSRLDVLIDAPPVKLEVQFRVDVRSRAADGSDQITPLADISPVVSALALQQFDSYVKQVRVFVHPRLRERIPLSQARLAELLLELADNTS